MKNLLTTLMILAFMLAAGSALAGAKVAINDNATLDIGYRVQALGTMMKTGDYDGDGQWDNVMDWKLRRARLRLGATVGEHMTAFLQTDVAGGGKPVEMIDAWVNIKKDNWLQFIAGRNMAPASRQNLTSSGALMAIDRPGLAYKSLTWGARTRAGFTNQSYAWSNEFTSLLSQYSDDYDINANPQAVRDMGLTLFGSGKVGENGSLKYYAAVNNGVQMVFREPLPANTTWDKNQERFTFRAQYNMWDAEPGFYNSSTYLGKKKTLAIGASYDMQSSVAQGLDNDAVVSADYKYFEIDAFLEYPMGDNGNALTIEGAFMNLDFGEYFKKTAGSGFYGQIGYYLASGFQPWFAFESWSSDEAALVAGDDPDLSEPGDPVAVQSADVGKVRGDFTSMRFGVSYYLDGQAANIKAGYEIFSSDASLNPTAAAANLEDTYGTFTLGFYTTY